MVSTLVYNRELVRSIKVIPTPTILTGMMIKLSAPRTSNITWKIRGPQA